MEAAEKWQRRQDKIFYQEELLKELKLEMEDMELKMRREEMKKERELKVVLDKERFDQKVRNARDFMM